MGLIITAPPTAEPVSQTEAKLHLRVDGTTDDTLIDSLIIAAREHAENFMHRAVMARTYKLTMDAFPTEFVLPVPPAMTVLSVQYKDAAGTTQTVTSTVYELDTGVEPPVVRLAYGQTWPTSRGSADDVWVNYVGGYAAPFTTTHAAETLAPVGYMPADDDVVRLSNRDGALPTGFSAGLDYYVVNAGVTTFQVSLTSGGAVVTISDNGTGEHFVSLASVGLAPSAIAAAMKMSIGNWYENREATIAGTIITPVPMGVDSLLWPYRFMVADS